MQNILKYNRYLHKPLSKNTQIYFQSKICMSLKTSKYKFYNRVSESFDKNPLIKEGGNRVRGFYRKSFFNRPLITIVTVVLNDDKDLEKTIKSVLLQKYNNVEFIIIDGGSRGSTISKIKKYDDRIDYWISQKDKGIYDAWNKGIKLASGDYICFLNVGDFFAQNCLEIVIKKIRRKHLDILFGSVLKRKKFSGFYPKTINNRLNVFPSFVSTFIKKSIYEKRGLFKIRYNCFNDYEFIYSLLKTRKFSWDISSRNEILTIFDLKGVSSKTTFLSTIKAEYQIRLQYENTLFVFFKLFKKFLKFYVLKTINKNKFDRYN